jgi:hypothetical protein
MHSSVDIGLQSYAYDIETLTIPGFLFALSQRRAWVYVTTPIYDSRIKLIPLIKQEIKDRECLSGYLIEWHFEYQLK